MFKRLDSKNTKPDSQKLSGLFFIKMSCPEIAIHNFIVISGQDILKKEPQSFQDWGSIKTQGFSQTGEAKATDRTN
jgi:hypothetical protein